MEQIQLAKGVTLSRIVAGCMRIQDSMDDKALLRFVEACLDMGVNSFDHAPVYGRYTCEKRFGDAVLRKAPTLRARMKLVTKAGITLPGVEGNKHIYYDAQKDSILKEVDASLQKLATDHVDLLLIHRPDPLTSPEETAEALETVVRQGKAVSVGVSNYSPAQFDALQRFLTVPLATNQLEFSVKSVDNFFNGTSDDLFRRGIHPMAWSPLGGGSVFKGSEPQSLRLREVIGEIAEAHGTTTDAIMYAWLLVHPLGILPITGTMDIRRVKTAVDAMDIRLSRDEWYAILAASRGVDVP